MQLCPAEGLSSVLSFYAQSNVLVDNNVIFNAICSNVEPSHDSSAEMSHLRFAITFRVRFQGKMLLLLLLLFWRCVATSVAGVKKFSFHRLWEISKENLAAGFNFAQNHRIAPDFPFPHFCTCIVSWSAAEKNNNIITTITIPNYVYYKDHRRQDCQTVPIEKCDTEQQEQCRNVPRQVLAIAIEFMPSSSFLQQKCLHNHRKIMVDHCNKL